MKKIFFILTTFMLFLGLSISTHAALIDLGDGMIYSTELDLTWLQDANYAQTSGFSSTGEMDWYTANTWATTLVYAGLDGWRLPTYDPLTVGQCPYSLPPSTDHEMRYLNEIELGRCPITSGASYLPFMNIPDPPHYWSGTSPFDDPSTRFYYWFECG